ncbi:GFA family protein [Paracoccus sp. CPCC 101403]|uniref:GFA family protein n=1 Tax=Paracoccus broussonetiae TaxID=3075834 RepID=A0ABU3EB70_9RHOB|nr:GFA family protein [Paracoccus sp. CPCC 101403]MDT1060725.1 GFA family protein [Paracoccus sp. CPCC 101403]
MSQTTYCGGCACGAVRYEATGAPVAELHCQCRHCQMRSGTGHSSYLVFAGVDAVRVAGRLQGWSVAGDSGNEKTHAFCPTCGTPVLLTFVAAPTITAIHPASLDAPERFHPTLVAYGSRALGWDHHDPALTVLAKGPPA